MLSGGMDSATALGLAIQECEETACIHFNYHQRSEQKELAAFENLCAYYRIEQKLIVSMDFLKQIGGSALTDRNIPVPDETPPVGIIPSTYVPFRNGIMLSLTAAWAEVLSVDSIYTGFVEEDSSGYPDCREIFVHSMEAAINLGRKPEVYCQLKTPLIHLKKSEILSLGYNIGVPYNLTWSCYNSGVNPCGVCPACRLRKQAFDELGLDDPVQ